jgi:hypothetical protein
LSVRIADVTKRKSFIVSRSPLLQQTLWDLERRFGSGVLTTAAALRGTHISTGFPELDNQLGKGGIAAGQLTVIAGMPTSGATSLLYRLIAQAQGDDRIAVYADTTHTFDAEAAVACGVCLERLLLIEVSESDRALNMTLDLLRIDQVALVALNWQGHAHSAWERLRANVITTRTALVVLRTQPERSTAAYTLLQPIWRAWLINEDNAITGYQVRVHIVRDGNTARDGSVDITLSLKGGRP